MGKSTDACEDYIPHQPEGLAQLVERQIHTLEMVVRVPGQRLSSHSLAVGPLQFAPGCVCAFAALLGLAVNPYPVMGEIAATIRAPNRGLLDLGPPVSGPRFPRPPADMTPGTPTCRGFFLHIPT